MKQEWNTEDDAALFAALQGADINANAFEPPAGLQQRLYVPTVAVLKQRRRTKYLAMGGLSGLAYAAGLLTMLLWPGDELATPEPQIIASAAPPPVVLTLPPVAPVPQDPQSLEAQAAFAPFEDRAGFLLRAADAYLNDADDVANALRCYHQYLALAPAEEIQVAGHHDSWLLLSLKQARLQDTTVSDKSASNQDAKKGA